MKIMELMKIRKTMIITRKKTMKIKKDKLERSKSILDHLIKQSTKMNKFTKMDTIVQAHSKI